MMQNNKKSPLPLFRLTALAMSLCAAQGSVYAMQALDEQDMRAVEGQDGIMLDTAYDSINIDRLYWEDKVGMVDGSDTALRAYADGVSITGNNLGTTYKVNAGSDAATGKAGVDLSIVSRYGTISAKEFKICDGAGNNCGDSPGGLTVQSPENAVLHFITKDGLFSPTSLSSAEISLKRVNIFLSQMEDSNLPLSTKINQLILKDFNFNFKGEGYMYVDAAKGLILETGTNGYVDLNRVCILDATACAASGLVLDSSNSKPGLNIDFVIKKDTGNTYDATTGTKGLIRVGASGNLKNASLTFRGTDGRSGSGNAMLGKAFAAGNATTTADTGSANIMGSTGLAMRMKADFTNTGANPTTLELAHGGSNAYGLKFSNFTPLITTYNGSGQENTGAGYFDSGNVYVNLANTKRMALPQNAVLNAAPFLTAKLTKPDDYQLLVSKAATDTTTPNPNAVIVAVRDAEFQAISRKTSFIASSDLAQPNNAGGTWGLGLPIYGLDANLAIYGTKFTGTPYGGTAVTNAQRLGFGLGLSTKGINTTALADGSPAGSKTTSILLIDGKKYHNTAATDGVRNAYTSGAETDYNPINYYIGLRNIDMLLSGYGSIGLEQGKLNLYIPQFMLSAAGQVAVGYLPGSQYKTLLNGVAKYAPTDSFLSNSDVLFGLRLRMAGSVDMTMVPGGATAATNFISFDGNLNLTSGAVQIVEPVDGSIIGFDNITGKLGFTNQIKIRSNNVDFNTALTINPDATRAGATEAEKAAGVLRIRDLNLYPATYTGSVPTGVGNAQRLGEMVFTGGKITSQFNITPH
ncbi:DUF6160 family protein [Acinetobacter parvus]|uniref:DUF6160 domain-containing protein n=1 Tax=Acinetobacter parvus NIPH 1103 TaxID=1217671 RepID=N8RB19_9GAMM|nr:DUF6160 family protein [Acinetobacter parvus]ENU32578.1 hypothetical protein F989_02562 [Acinetobacter parvus NIPH 1103]